MHYTVPVESTSASQRSLKTAIGCVGAGNGRKVSMTFQPAPCDSGIVFHRSDIGLDIVVASEAPSSTGRGCAGTESGIAGLGPVLQALVGRGITNARVELDGAVVPMLRDPVADFQFLISCAGIVDQSSEAVVDEPCLAA